MSAAWEDVVDQALDLGYELLYYRQKKIYLVRKTPLFTFYSDGHMAIRGIHYPTTKSFDTMLTIMVDNDDVVMSLEKAKELLAQYMDEP